MLALRLDDRVRLVADHPAPVRAPGEALLRMRLAGICDTDLQLSRGYMGYRGVLGHELVAEVLEADSPEWRRRRVVADINAGCGACSECLAHGGHHCAARTVLGILGRDGALAESCVVPERCLTAVPDALEDERAVFAEPLAAALHVLDDLERVPRGEHVVVLGDGKLGLLVSFALLAAGRPVALIGHHAAKLALAASAGAQTVLEHELGDRLHGSAAVVEATGSAQGIARALELVRPHGTVIFKTTVAGRTSVDLSPIVINELEVRGSRCGNLARAVDELAKHSVDPTALIAARYPLSRADAALEHAAQKGILKVLVGNPG